MLTMSTTPTTYYPNSESDLSLSEWLQEEDEMEREMEGTCALLYTVYTYNILLEKILGAIIKICLCLCF